VDAGIGVGVASVEVKILVRDSRAGASDVDLNTAGVELRTSSRVDIESGVCLVKRNDLLSNQILAGSECRRQGEVFLALVGNQLIDCPGSTVIPLLSYLGPDCTRPVGCGVWGDIGDDGALVRGIDDVVTTGIMIPFEGEGVTSSCRDELAHGSSSVDVAHQVRTGQVLDGVVVRW
jgi:hypothetical protein